MALPLVVNLISAQPDFRTTNSTGQNPLPILLPIWTLTKPRPAAWYIDGPTGSKSPVTFHIPNNITATYTINLEFEGVFTFPTAWVGHYVVTASLGGTEVLKSPPGDIPPPPPSAPVPTNLMLNNFIVSAPITTAICPIPFRWAGDFEWKIYNVEVPVNTASSQPVTSRLELCWASAEASAGPLFVNSDLLKTRVNFNSSYPVGLLRQFWPQPTEFNTIPNIISRAVYGPWYANRAMQTIWSWATPHQPNRPQYDCIQGAPAYNVGYYGGSFNLNQWLAACAPGGTCNCYDLAAISQLACAVFLDQNGNEELFSQWVYQNPNGFVLPGTLYGRDTEPNCNNPFWLQAPISTAYVDPTLDPNTANRRPFSNHAWVEVSNDAGMTMLVLDATHGTSAQPDSGTRTRSQYANAQIDNRWNTGIYLTRFGNLNNRGAVNPNGSCYQTPQFHLKSTPPSRIDRIGVYDALGSGPPPVVTFIPSLPATMRTTLEAVLELGANHPPPTQAFHDAPLHSNALSPLLTSSRTDLTLFQKFITIGKSISEISLQFANKANTESYVLNIQVHDNYLGPVNALIHRLMGYEASLTDVISATQSPLGRTSLRDQTSTFWIRGNLFITLRHNPPSPSSTSLSSFLSELHSLATAVDTYLQAGSVQPPLHLQPDTQLAAPAPKTVKVNELFTLRLAEAAMERNYEQMVGWSSDESVIASEGVAETGSGVFNFMALKEGKAVLEIRVAQRETLFPRTAVIGIQVVA